MRRESRPLLGCLRDCCGVPGCAPAYPRVGIQQRLLEYDGRVVIAESVGVIEAGGVEVGLRDGTLPRSAKHANRIGGAGIADIDVNAWQDALEGEECLPTLGSRVTRRHAIGEAGAARLGESVEPARLEIMNRLRGGELTVTELVRETGLGQANLSRHLQLLHAHGFVARRKEGVSVYYSLATSVDELCDIMSNQINAQVTSRRRTLAT